MFNSIFHVSKSTFDNGLTGRKFTIWQYGLDPENARYPGHAMFVWFGAGRDVALVSGCKWMAEYPFAAYNPITEEAFACQSMRAIYAAARLNVRYNAGFLFEF